MPPLSGWPFAKMNGAGNSILVLDARGGPPVTGADARRIGERAPFDQLMALGPPRTPGTGAFVTIWNIDGSPAGACGNGTRCVAWFLAREGMGGDVTVETAAGRLFCTREGETRWTVDMGSPGFAAGDLPFLGAIEAGTALVPAAAARGLPPAHLVSMGNPHAVFFVPDALAVDLAEAGRAIETDPVFPERVNVSFATLAAPDRLTLRVWERGAGATLACGSAACASVVAGARAGLLAHRADVDLPGGTLGIDWTGEGTVRMSGPVELEFEGTVDPLTFAPVAA